MNSEVPKPPSQLCFSLLSVIIFFITITGNETWNTEIHKTDQSPAITNHKPWPFEPVGVNFCFLRGLLRWLMAVKNSYVSCLLDFRICVFLESAVSLDKIQRCNSTLFECFLVVLSCLFNYSTTDAFFLTATGICCCSNKLDKFVILRFSTARVILIEPWNR